ncbi:MAG: NAD(P)-binding domain-containing protein [Solirubrobacterales bacterium]|nr:NAD(P)-binding domain-containing protein [Solirubrobacterales bacterium]MCB8971094.1 NAD(P)-binding domain-containing protein [Thermoleophilales bacterium]MCO5327908.1 NAD(P)-binding domain-containing protein [Solirubrobacterales bacterium]
MSTAPRTCIIGAGSTGIAVAKALYERGIDFDSYELSDRVGGNWVLGNVNGVSSSYSSLHINTSRERMEYSDYPMPKDYPDFPRHDHIAAYFDDYVDHFGFRDRIKFGVGVEHVEPAEGGGFDVRTSEGETVHYDAVVVANGHHWDARWPEPAFPGSDTFEGEQIHAHDYKNEKQLRDKDVVVLGMGNSAMDIAVDASYHAKSTILAARRGAWILPKYLFGKPVDKENKLLDHMPASVRWPILQKLLASQVGKPSDYGLPEPDHKLGHAHPTVSGRILDRLAHGAITVKPNIASLEGETVRFTDGTEAHTDLVVYCTGYKITFPFFDHEFISADDNRLRLYMYMFHPDVENLYFPGLIQPLGAIMPIAERQGVLIGESLLGNYELPGRAEMEHEIDEREEKMRKRYVASKRHTIQVDAEPYMRTLAKEIEAGRERALSGAAASVGA